MSLPTSSSICKECHSEHMELTDMHLLYLYSSLLATSSAYVNIALNKPTYQQYPLSPNDPLFDSGNAVDGRKTDTRWDGGQCAVSDYYKKTATWWVNLTSIHSIHHITILFMTKSLFLGSFGDLASALLGFSVHISNTTDRFRGTLCFKDDIFTKSTLPAALNVSCPVHGQYVIYYNKRQPGVVYPDDYLSVVVSDLCEVEVYGCPTIGFYGPNCSTPCPTNCRYCHIERGTCQGCKPGFKGHDCELECSDGKYGDGCQSDCGHCSNLTQCHHVDGTCVGGCQPGYKLGHCQEPCDKGWYGIDCNEPCGHCIKDTRCLHTNGTCLLGCTDGFQGNICKMPCQHGYYGQNCSEKCNDTCLGCNNVNGVCDSGCITGWRGDFCQSECSDGRYGDGCQSECGYCYNMTQCHHVDGTCVGGCQPGYRLDQCQDPCLDGSHGSDCNETCGHCLEESQCSHINGTCNTGCNFGYLGVLCKDACPRGYFGKACSENCSEKCAGCNNVNGVCEFGCIAGWTGNFCQSGIEFYKIG